MLRCLELSIYLKRPHYHGRRACFITYYEVDGVVIFDLYGSGF